MKITSYFRFASVEKNVENVKFIISIIFTRYIAYFGQFKCQVASSNDYLNKLSIDTRIRILDLPQTRVLSSKELLVTLKSDSCMYTNLYRTVTFTVTNVHTAGFLASAFHKSLTQGWDVRMELHFGFQLWLSFFLHPTPVFRTWFLLNSYIRLIPNIDALICCYFVFMKSTSRWNSIIMPCFLANNSNRASWIPTVVVVLSYMIQTNVSRVWCHPKSFFLLIFI